MPHLTGATAPDLLKAAADISAEVMASRTFPAVELRTGLRQEVCGKRPEDGDTC
jgi:hypothetical protein